MYILYNNSQVKLFYWITPDAFFAVVERLVKTINDFPRDATSKNHSDKLSKDIWYLCWNVTYLINIITLCDTLNYVAAVRVWEKSAVIVTYKVHHYAILIFVTKKTTFTSIKQVVRLKHRNSLVVSWAQEVAVVNRVSA